MKIACMYKPALLTTFTVDRSHNAPTMCACSEGTPRDVQWADHVNADMTQAIRVLAMEMEEARSIHGNHSTEVNFQNQTRHSVEVVARLPGSTSMVLPPSTWKRLPSADLCDSSLGVCRV